jgi:hypothetical protein
MNRLHEKDFRSGRQGKVGGVHGGGPARVGTIFHKLFDAS